MIEENCGNCRFFEIEPMPDDFNPAGTCRRAPPVYIGGDDDELAWLQPITHECDWCGEWRPIKIKPK